ncbi:hypothetical protein BRADI_1g54470v3 [Brachypodium distachyon]|uniref:Uncharacterized protein n=1 Tax=Brachypodium distachyon TaxID=15368 RepID=I1H2S6_BRADI|nr:hypothetical protein BRADI_1g54470v3 [Brachypodium distachyon]
MARVVAPIPVAWLEGDVLAEYVRFLQEAEAAAAQLPGPGGVKWLEGEVLADFLEFLGEDVDERAGHYSVSSGGAGGSNSGDFMEEDNDEDEEEMAYMLRHITSLPAVMAREAALQD